MTVMAVKLKTQSKKVRINGTVDSDVLQWLERSRGKEKFSAHLNNVLRGAMNSKAQTYPSLEEFQGTMNNILDRMKVLQNRVESIEGEKQAPVKRSRGRPRKTQTTEHAKAAGRDVETLGSAYEVRDDVQWYLSHDRYKKVKAEPLVNAFDMVVGKFDAEENITVATLKEGYDREQIGVPYPTFRLFYFPLIRDRLLEKKMIEKVDRPGKKGVYRKK
jgi:hypothetical protein